jgi:putative flippase GtrA
MLDRLHSLFSLRFLKFCAVGASGVVVNLLFLAIFSELAAIQVNIASALAIEMSINSNFLINEIWTFRDRHAAPGRLLRWAKFHLVSLVGGAVQWVVFIGCNLLLYMIVEGEGRGSQEADLGVVEQYLIRPVTHPPDVGNLKYLSQLLGIGAATFWNYVANFYWTWAKREEAGDG